MPLTTTENAPSERTPLANARGCAPLARALATTNRVAIALPRAAGVPLNFETLERLMPMNRSIVGALLAAASIEASADGWATFSQHTSMKGYVIVEVGEVSEVQPPFNTKWNENVFQMNGRCFTFPGYMGMWGFGSKAAILLANAQKDVKLALIESAIGSIKVELQSIGIIQCPSGTNVLPYSDDPEERLRLLRKKLEELKKR